MYKANVKGECKKFWTKSLSDLKVKDGFEAVKVVNFDGTYDAYGVDKPKVEHYTDEEVAAAIEEIKAVKDKYPTDRDIISFVNDRAKQAARQALMLKAVTDAGFIQPTLKDDAGLRFARIKATMKASFPTLPDSVLDTMVKATLDAAEAQAATVTDDTTEE